MSNLFVNNYTKFVRGFAYMSGIDRDDKRVKKSAEVFTPTPVVNQILGWYDHKAFSENQEFVDIACGDGQFLVEIVIKKLTMGISLKDCLQQTYGSDIMIDNVNKCRQRLAGPNPSDDIKKILNHNIICADALDPKHKGWQKEGYMWEGKKTESDFFDFS